MADWLGLIVSVPTAILAISSNTIADSTLAKGVLPHVNGPWPATRTAGIESGLIPENRRTITLPVLSS